MAQKDLSAEPLAAGFVTLYGATDFLDTYMVAALDGTGDFAGMSDDVRTVAAKKNMQAILVLYANHEAVEALEQAELGVALNAPKESGSNNIYYDEYYAFWYGLTGENAPAEVTRKRDADFGTTVLNEAFASFEKGREAALDADVAGIEAAQEEISAGFLKTFLQATLKYSYKVQAGTGDDGDWAEGYTYWRVVSGIVAAENLAAAQAIDALLWPAPSRADLRPRMYCQIKSKIEAALPIKGVTYADLGELTQDHGKGIVISADACGPLPVEESSKVHASIALDVGEIEAFLGQSPPNYAAAKELYSNGKNSAKGSGLRTLQGMAQKDLSAEPLAAGFVTLYGATDFLDTYMVAALDGTGDFAGMSDDVRTVAAKKNMQAILVLYANHEAVEALEQAELGVALNAPKESGSNNIYYDEYYAFWYGLTGENAPAEVTRKRDADFGTTVLNEAFASFEKGREAALDADVAGIEAAQEEISAGFLKTFLQATLKYSYKVQAGTGDDGDWAEGYTYWRVVSGIVAAENLAAAQAIDALLWPAPSRADLRPRMYCQIKSKIEAALPIKGVTYADLGELTQDHGKGIVISADACPLPVAADEEEEEEADSPASRAQVSLLGAALVGVASVALML